MKQPRVMLDPNVVLDVLLRRQPYYNYSHQIWQADVAGQVVGYLAAFSLPTIFYLVQTDYHKQQQLGKQQANQQARSDIRTCLRDFEFCPLLERHLNIADSLSGQDYEDNLQVACAVDLALDAIVTRNPKDFRFASSLIQIYTPEQLLRELGLLK